MRSFVRGVLQRTRKTTSRVRRVRGGDTTLVGLVIGSVSALVLAAGGVSWSVGTKAAAEVSRVPVFAGLGQRPPQTANGSVDILFAATERPTGKAEAGERSIAYLVLVHVSRRHGSTVLVDIPRSSTVEVPKHRDSSGKSVADGKLPLALAYEHGGPRLLVESLEGATDVHLDGYAELSLPAVAEVVDAAEGIELCVPARVEDKAAKLDLAPGPQRLTGAQAEAFARSAAGGSLERVRRVQLLFGAAVQRLFGATAAADLLRNDALLIEGGEALRVDERFDLVLSRRLTLALRTPYGKNTSIVAVPVGRTAKTKNGTVSSWQEPLAAHLFEELRKDAALDPELFTPAPVHVRARSVRVRVDNGTGIEGLAGKAVEDLRGVGFAVGGKPGNAENGVEHTTIYHGAAREKHARALQAAIPGAQLKATKKTSRTLRVVLGADYTSVRPVTYVKGAEADETDDDYHVTGAGPCAAPSG